MAQIPIAGGAIPADQCPYPIQECPYPIQGAIAPPAAKAPPSYESTINPENDQGIKYIGEAQIKIQNPTEYTGVSMEFEKNHLKDTIVMWPDINVDSKKCKSVKPTLKTNYIGSNKVIPSTAHFVETSAPVITEQPTAEVLKPEPNEDSCENCCENCVLMIAFIILIPLFPIFCLCYCCSKFCGG